MFQSYESIGTETKPQEKKVKQASVRILTVAPLGKDSSIKMQVWFPRKNITSTQ